MLHELSTCPASRGALDDEGQGHLRPNRPEFGIRKDQRCLVLGCIVHPHAKFVVFVITFFRLAGLVVSQNRVRMGPIHESLVLPAPLAVGISPASAHLLSLLFTTSYVGSLYIFQALRPRPRARSSHVKGTRHPVVPPVAASDVDAIDGVPEPGSRDHPDTIRLRMKAVSVATAASIFGVWLLVKETGGYGLRRAVRPSLPNNAHVC